MLLVCLYNILMGTCQLCHKQQHVVVNQKTIAKKHPMDNPDRQQEAKVKSQPPQDSTKLKVETEKPLSNVDINEEVFNLQLPEQSRVLLASPKAGNLNQTRVDLGLGSSFFRTQLSQEPPNAIYRTRLEDPPHEKINPQPEPIHTEQKSEGETKQVEVKKEKSIKKAVQDEVRETNIQMSYIRNDWYSIMKQVQEEQRLFRMKQKEKFAKAVKA